MPNSPLSDSHGPLLRRIASTTRNVRIDILDEQETLLAPVGLCDLCSMPNKPGYDYCYPCSTAPRAAVDGLIPLAFAPKGEQLYRDLVAYKRQSTPSPASDAWRHWPVSVHATCPASNASTARSTR